MHSYIHPFDAEFYKSCPITKPSTSPDKAIYEYREIEEADVNALFHYQCGSSYADEESVSQSDEEDEVEDRVEYLNPSFVPNHLPPFPDMSTLTGYTEQEDEGKEGEDNDKKDAIDTIPPSSRLPVLSEETLKNASASGIAVKSSPVRVSSTIERNEAKESVTSQGLRRSTLPSLPKWLSRMPPPRKTPKVAVSSMVPPSQSPVRKRREGEAEGEVEEGSRKKKQRPLKVAPRNAPETTETLFTSAPLADDMTSDRVGSERSGSVGTVPVGVIRRVVRERGQDAARASLPIALTDAHKTHIPLHLASSPIPTNPSTPPQADCVRLRLSAEGKAKGDGP